MFQSSSACISSWTMKAIASVICFDELSGRLRKRALYQQNNELMVLFTQTQIH